MIKKFISGNRCGLHVFTLILTLATNRAIAFDLTTTAVTWGVHVTKSLPGGGDSGDQKGASLSFENNAGKPALTGNFALSWDGYQFGSGVASPSAEYVWTDSIGGAAQAALDSTSNTPNAWEFKAIDTIGQASLKPGHVLTGGDATFSLDYQTDKNFEMKKYFIEEAFTPNVPDLDIGKFDHTVGRDATPEKKSQEWMVDFQWRPLPAIDEGWNLDSGSSNETDANILRLVGEMNANLSINCVRNLFNLESVILGGDFKYFWLPEEIDTKNHNYLDVTLDSDFTDNFGFEIEYSSGEDSPDFTFENKWSGGFTIKFI
jgi:hypothetical protein